MYYRNWSVGYPSVFIWYHLKIGYPHVYVVTRAEILPRAMSMATVMFSAAAIRSASKGRICPNYGWVALDLRFLSVKLKCLPWFKQDKLGLS